MIATLSHYFRLIIAIVMFAGIGWILYDFVTGYLVASGDRITRVLHAMHNSLTILWARFSMIVGLLIGAIVEGADYFQLPGLAAIVMNYLTPTTVSVVTVGSMIITEIARRRSL